jgi:hypothetical protein
MVTRTASGAVLGRFAQLEGQLGHELLGGDVPIGALALDLGLGESLDVVPSRRSLVVVGRQMASPAGNECCRRATEKEK